MRQLTPRGDEITSSSITLWLRSPCSDKYPSWHVQPHHASNPWTLLSFRYTYCVCSLNNVTLILSLQGRRCNISRDIYSDGQNWPVCRFHLALDSSVWSNHRKHKVCVHVTISMMDIEQWIAFTVIHQDLEHCMSWDNVRLRQTKGDEIEHHDEHVQFRSE